MKPKISHNDWILQSDGDSCVVVTIGSGVNLEDLQFQLISAERIPIVTMKVMNRTFHLCSNLHKPVFAQLGDSMKYVTGSGDETYK
jgi:hypothetical protein